MPGGIVQIVQRLTPGGLEVLAIDLSRRLGGDNPIVSLELTAEAILAAWPDIPLPLDAMIGMGKAQGLTPGLIPKLARRLRALRPRAVLTHHVGPLLYGTLAARLAGVPVIAHVEHDVWHYDDPRHRWIAGMVARLVRPRVVAVSQAVADEMATVMPGCPVTVIRNAVDTDRFRPQDRAEARRRFDLPVEARIVGVSGRLEHVKGQDVFLRAFAQVPGAVAVLAGQGSHERMFRTLATELGIADRVIFLGYRADMEALYPAFDVVALPSRAEGLPLSVLEAQACGIPVVASDVGSVREGLCPDVSLAVPPEDPPALAAALNLRLDHPPAGDPRAFVTGHFSWDRMVADYRRLLTPEAA